MPDFKCQRGHVTTLPEHEITEESITFKVNPRYEDIGGGTLASMTTATHDLGIDRDTDGREYISCGWISDDEEETPDTVGQSQAMRLELTKVRGTIKTEDKGDEEWYCTERAYRID